MSRYVEAYIPSTTGLLLGLVNAIGLEGTRSENGLIEDPRHYCSSHLVLLLHYTVHSNMMPAFLHIKWTKRCPWQIAQCLISCQQLHDSPPTSPHRVSRALSTLSRDRPCPAFLRVFHGLDHILPGILEFFSHNSCC